MTAILDRPEMRTALRALRHRRRVQRLRHLDWVDTVYRAYVVGISLIAALMTLAAIVGDRAVGPRILDTVRNDGAAIAGILVAILIGIGLRSGTHGGPLAFEAADVHHVLLAPIDRGIVVRSAAYRQLRGVVTAGVLVGALAGLTAGPRFSRHGHDTAAWVLSGIAFGLLAALATWASALLGSAGHLTQNVALAIAAALTLWSVGDVMAHTTSSPLTMLGHLAIWPLDASWVASVGIAFVFALLGFSIRNAGRISLEPAEHRARLVRSLKYAATIQDLRAVITLRRQLAHEDSRRRPWLTLRSRARTGRPGWRRDWHGILRWPGARLSRVFILTLISGASCAGGLRGTTPLFAIAVIAAYVVALDAVEGLAQEVDHPDRTSGVPIEPGPLYIGHLGAPMALMGALALIGYGAGLGVMALTSATKGAGSVSPLVGLAVAGALTMVAPTAAAVSVYLGRPDRDLSLAVLNPGVAVAQQVAPVIVVALAFLPFLVAELVHAPTDPVRAAFAAAAPAVAIAFGIRAFLRSRRSVIT